MGELVKLVQPSSQMSRNVHLRVFYMTEPSAHGVIILEGNADNAHKAEGDLVPCKSLHTERYIYFAAFFLLEHIKASI